MVNSSNFFGLLKEFLIEDLIGLENSLNGHGVFVIKKLISSEGEKKEEQFFVDLEVDQVYLNDLTEGEIEANYSDYSIKNPGFHEEIYLQRLNYDGFLSHENHFVGTVDYMFDIKGKRVQESFQDYLKFNFDNYSGIMRFTKAVFEEFEECLSNLQKNFNSSDDYIIYHYDGTSSNDQITAVMKLALKRQKELYDWLHEIYLSYNFPTTTKNREKLNGEKDRIWYKLAKLIISGRLRYENNHYVFDHTDFSNSTKASEPVGEEIGAKPHTVRVYLSESISSNKNPSDKNIFAPSRLEDLLGLIEQYPEANISLFFKKKLEKLKENRY